jgi:hypothetical protein
MTLVLNALHTGTTPVLIPTRTGRRFPPRPARRGSRVFFGPRWTGHWQLEGRSRYRIFNTAEYRFYRSNTPTPPSTPFATNASLPHTPTDTFGDGEWYLWVTYFNGIIESPFLPIGDHGETYRRIDISGGAAVDVPPYGPLEWHLERVAAGVVRVVGVYYHQDSTLRAEEWAIAYTNDGSDPPADSPDLTEEMPADGLCVLQYDLPGQVHGTNLKVRVQARRNDGSWVYSEDSEIKSLTADATGPTAPLDVDRYRGQLPQTE